MQHTFCASVNLVLDSHKRFAINIIFIPMLATAQIAVTLAIIINQLL